MKINVTKLKENAPTIINALILLAICIGICVLDSKLDEMDRSLSWEIRDKDTSAIEYRLSDIEKELEKQTSELEQWRLEREEQRREQIQREWERSRYRY